MRARTTGRPEGTLSRRMERRAATSGALGSALEYFDFAIYGALSATLFPELFFHDLGESSALLASFATFGVGFVARPVGAIVFGHLGDKIGRRPILYMTLVIMGLSSVLIGLLPTGKGVVVACLLVGLRFLQGLSLGGEATGNQLMTMEHADSRVRGLYGALVTAGAPISQVVATLTLVILTSTLTDQQWASWGWRIPFLASILIVAIAAFIRLRVEETPAFVARRGDRASQKGERRSGLHVLLTHPREILKLTLTWGGNCWCFYLIAVYGLVLLREQTPTGGDYTFAILLTAHAISIPFCLGGGMLSDRIGRKRTMIIGQAGCAVGLVSFFLALDTGSAVLAALAISWTLSSNQLCAGAQPALFAECFPTQYRFSGCALPYTFANVLFAAPAPIIATALVGMGGLPALMWFSLCVMLVALVALFTLTDHRGVDLITPNNTTADTPARDDHGIAEPSR
ncbi:MAG: MFS transporter [Hyphomicrobiales bacterium]|nr:MAG: MFS transporter [Hyphomicrobiales bacterium]